MYLATLNWCDAEKLRDHPNVETINLNAAVNLDGDKVTGASARKRQASSGEGVGFATAEGGVDPNSSSNDQEMARRLSKRRGPTETSIFRVQRSSPDHLRWLTGLSFMRPMIRTYYEVDDFIWDDPSRDGGGVPNPVVFVTDSYFNRAHPEYAGRVLYSLPNSGDQVPGPLVPPPDGTPPHILQHGTCMASLAAGSYYGVAKNANLVLAQIGGTLWDASRMLLTTWNRVVSTNMESRAVVSMSWCE